MKPTKRISVRFLWYDFWIGVYVDRENKRLYVCPLPMVCIRIEYGKRCYFCRDFTAKHRPTRIGS